MFSIIVCSIEPVNFEKLSKSISRTIGEVEFELIRIDNKVLNGSIAEAYNKGVAQSKYPFLILVHEDVIFHTKGWGEKLLEVFKSPEVGLIGIAGSRIKTDIPSGWWNNRPENILMHIIQHNVNKIETVSFGFKNDHAEEVTVIDGVFMAARKTEQIRFDETLKGFHNYDQSLSLLYRKHGYKVMVTNQILLEHFSAGKKDENWIKSQIIFHDLYSKDLPQCVDGYKINKKDKLFSLRRFIHNCRINGRKDLEFRYWLKYFYLNPLDKENVSMIRYFLGLK